VNEAVEDLEMDLCSDEGYWNDFIVELLGDLLNSD